MSREEKMRGSAKSLEKLHLALKLLSETRRQVISAGLSFSIEADVLFSVNGAKDKIQTYLKTLADDTPYELRDVQTIPSYKRRRKGGQRKTVDVQEYIRKRREKA